MHKLNNVLINDGDLNTCTDQDGGFGEVEAAEWKKEVRCISIRTHKECASSVTKDYLVLPLNMNSCPVNIPLHCFCCRHYKTRTYRQQYPHPSTAFIRLKEM